MASKIIPFGNNLPEKGRIILADCCFLYDFYYGSSDTTNLKFEIQDLKRMRQVKKYTDKLVTNDNIIVIPPIARQELMGLCERDIIGDESSEAKRRMENDSTLIGKAQERFDAIEVALQADPLFFLDKDDLTYNLREVKDISKKENLKFKDSLYIDYMRKKDLFDLLTVDKDFTRLNDPKTNVFIDTENYKKYIKRQDFYSLQNNLGQAIIDASNKRK